MNILQRIMIIVPALLVFFVHGALAQVTNDINVTAIEGQDFIQVQVTMDIGGDLPASWVGWTVERRTIGTCDSEVFLGSVRPFESGEHAYQFQDNGVLSALTYYYRVHAVDDQGSLQYLGSPPLFPPAYYHDTYASPGGSGLVVEGVTVDLGWTLGIAVCPGECWEPVSFISEVPSGMVPGITVRIHGTLDNEFEGPYISSITSWTALQGCDPVAAETSSWGRLKALHY